MFPDGPFLCDVSHIYIVNKEVGSTNVILL